MIARGVLQRLTRRAARRPWPVLAAVAAVSALGGALALTLSPSAATDTLAGRSSETFAATERHRERFGDHAIAVLVRGRLSDLVLTADLGRLLGLEGCLSGARPRGVPAPGGPSSPCAELARTRPVLAVHGPGTFVNAAVGEIQDRFRARLAAATREAERAGDAARRLAVAGGRSRAQARRAARAASDLVLAQFSRDLVQTAVRYGIPPRMPYVDDPDLVAALVFDDARGPSMPKARFASLFPGRDAALISVRLRPDLDDEAHARAIGLVREAVAMPRWRLAHGDYVVTGAPVLAEDLADALTGSLLRLVAIGLLVMALVLAVAFRSRLRLAPLAIALGAVATTFGAMAVAGAPLTMAAVAVLPVLLGLGVDYAIQYQARVEEFERDADAQAAIGRAARSAVPALATAALAAAAGFLVLLLSPVPMVRGFGLLLVAGIAVAFAFALTAGTAALAVSARRAPRAGVVAGSARSVAARPGAGAPARSARAGVAALPGAGAVAPSVRAGVVARRVAALPGAGTLARSARGAAELVAAGRAAGAVLLRPAGAVATRAARRAVATAAARPVPVLAAAAVLAAGGWALDSRAEVVSDVDRLVPQDLPALQDLRALQARTGVAGEIDVVVEGSDLTDPAVVAWMGDYRDRLLRRHGWSPARGCGQAALCPALSLPDLFRAEGTASSRRRIREVLGAVPPSFTRAVIAADRRTATLGFGIKLLPLERQQEVIASMREALDPPPGVTARLAGLPVLAAEANAALSSPWRRLGMAVAGLLAVALVLLAVHRRWRRAWVPLVPIALATGWSALVVWLLQVPLNPLSATLGALVLAISTEFSVLLAARFREEREAGHPPAVALRRTYASTGVAVLASGATAIAGFAVLALSDVKMLQDFGLVTVIDLTVSLLGVLAILPAVLVLADRRDGDGRRRSAGAARRRAVAA